MQQPLNSPKEMARRLAFLIYVACSMVFIIELVVTLARPGLRNLLIALAAFMALSAVRYAGYRWLEFRRMFESFPAGCVLDSIPEPVRKEVERLVAEFHAAGTDWVRRTEIRHRLVELEERQPEIKQAYSADLKQVLAA